MDNIHPLSHKKKFQEHSARRNVVPVPPEKSIQDDLDNYDLDEDSTSETSEVRSLDDQGPVDSGAESQISSDQDMADDDAEAEANVGEDSDEVANDDDTKPKRKQQVKTSKKPSEPAIRGIDESYPPISKLDDIFDDMTTMADTMGFSNAVFKLQGLPINVATMCSGTEAPLLALQMINESLRRKRQGSLRINHCFSVEIVPRKQAYIERNFHPAHLFRDIREFGAPNKQYAMTAYGSRVRIPKDIDFLIAGFPCVDFSNKNTNKKTLEELGESGEALLSILLYAKKDRPAIILLENVEHASWKQLQALWGNDRDAAREFLADSESEKTWLIWDDENPGYANIHTLVDTKQYYIPHTRRRGYMFLVRKDLIAHKRPVLQVWQDTLLRMKRPASVSVEAFLLPADSPHLQKAKYESGKIRYRASPVEWVRVKERHREYRESNHLGSLRALTKWVEGGTAVGQDYWWPEWIAVQVERVWDTMDISFIRKGAKDVDALYKTNVWELSQSVDRDEDTHPFGVTGCVTPTGQPFLTTRGGPLTGREVLALQGLPLQKLILNKETPRELQDLAGNAMTGTVVGSALISAVIAMYKPLARELLKRQGAALEQPLPASEKPVMEISRGALGSSKVLTFAGSLQKSFTQIRAEATKSIRMCYCEGSTHLAKSRILACKDCGHRSCKDCGIAPSHAYEPLHDSSRVIPRDFRDSIKEFLPMRLYLHAPREELNDLAALVKGVMEPEDRKIVQEALINAMDAEYQFHVAKRSQYWDIVYESDLGHLHLIFNKNGVQWLLYGSTDPKLAANSRTRQLLKNPIARMKIYTDDILSGSWELCMPATDTFKLKFEGKGPEELSWKNKLGLKEFQKEKVWSRLLVTYESRPKISLDVDISGEYQLFSKCGTACSSLYKKTPLSEIHINGQDVMEGIEAPDQPALFLFLDPGRITKAEEDSFVFAWDPRRLEYQEQRQIVAYLDPAWRPQNKPVGLTEIEESAPPEIEVTMSEEDELIRTMEHSVLMETEVPDPKVDRPPHWNEDEPYVPKEDIPVENKKQRKAREKKEEEQRKKETPFESIDCHVSGEWIQCRASLEAFEGPQPATYAILRTDPAVKIFHPAQPGSWSPKYDCATSAAVLLSFRVPLTSPGWWESEDWKSVDAIDQKKAFERITWLTNRSRNPPGFSRGWRIVDLPESDISCLDCSPKHATIKWSKLPGKTKIFPYEDERQAGQYERGLKNRPTPFIFRHQRDEDQCGNIEIALNFAALAHRAFGRLGEIAIGSQPKLLWRLDTHIEQPIVFAPPKLEIYNNDGVSEDDYEFPIAGVNLRKEQRRSLTWMLAQESKDAEPWQEQEVEEAIIETLKWRIEVHATKKSKVLGGILADQVGYGKTATTLALIHKQKSVTDAEASQGCNHSIVLKATLLILPDHLIDQWKEEIGKFLGGGYQILVVTNVTELKKVTIADFQCADFVIITAKLFDSPAYWNKVTLLANVSEGPAPGSRAFKSWHDLAQSRIDDNISELMARGTPDEVISFFDQMEVGRLAGEQDPNLHRKAPSKLTRGAKYVRYKADMDNTRPVEMDAIEEEIRKGYDFFKKIGSNTSVGRRSDAWRNLKCPCFEMFTFARTVIDEHTYIAQDWVDTLGSLKAGRRWILSGTPQLEGFPDASRMASLIGANLGIMDGAGEEQNKSDAEAFQAYGLPYSEAWHMTRHRYAQKFLSQFARKNQTELGHLRLERNICPQEMYPMEKVIYKELQTILELTDFKVLHGVNAKGLGDRYEEAAKLLGENKSAPEALLKASTFFSPNTNQIVSEDFNSLINLESRRRQGLSQLTRTLARNISQAFWLDTQVKTMDPEEETPQYPDRSESVDESMSESESEETDLAENEDESDFFKGEFNYESGDSDRESIKGPLASSGDTEVPGEDRDYGADYDSWTVRAKSQSNKVVLDVLNGIIHTVERDCRPEHEELFYRDPVSDEQIAEEKKEDKTHITKARKLQTEADQNNNVLKGMLHQGDISLREFEELKSQAIDDMPTIDRLPVKLPKGNLVEYEQARFNAVLKLDASFLEYLQRAGSLRYVTRARDLVAWRTGRQMIFPCESCNRPFENPHDVWINASCGHRTCDTCLGNHEHIDHCLADFCMLPASTNRMRRGDDFGHLEDANCRYGGKLDAIIKLLKSLDKKDQAILFVPYEELMPELEGALTASGIDNTALREDCADQNSQLMRKFKTDKSFRVIILNSSNETASGSNLPNANHVIFITPRDVPKKYLYDSSKEQCIGRALRHGQRKCVYVHEFVALDTFDVDVYQYREEAKLAKRGTPEAPRWELVKEKDLTAEEKQRDYRCGYHYRFADDVREE